MGGRARSNSIETRGIAGSFVRQLEELMATPGSTTPHTVRCKAVGLDPIGAQLLALS